MYHRFGCQYRPDCGFVGAFANGGIAYTQNNGTTEQQGTPRCCQQRTDAMAGSAYSDETARLRLLECWLPLAQEANRLYGWGCTSPDLEHLIIRAAPRLNQAHNVLQAHGILWHQYRLLRANTRHADDAPPSTKKL